MIQEHRLDRQQENILAALSYLFGFFSGFFILFLIKKNTFVRFHALQSVMTFLFFLLVTVVFELLPIIGAYLGAIMIVLSFGVWLFMMLFALQGKKYKLPWIGDAVDKQIHLMR